jgi:hypothetical protein
MDTFDYANGGHHACVGSDYHEERSPLVVLTCTYYQDTRECFANFLADDDLDDFDYTFGHLVDWVIGRGRCSIV